MASSPFETIEKKLFEVAILTTELLEMADTLKRAANSFNTVHKEKLKALMDAATEIHKSWSGSNMGYHAQVYYRDLERRPPGAQFSAEWGLEDMSLTGLGSVGNWCEYDADTVKSRIYNMAGNPDLDEATEESGDLAELVNSLKSEVLSALSLSLDESWTCPAFVPPQVLV